MLILYFATLLCLSCCFASIPEFQLTSKFNNYEDNDEPLNWTLGISSLDISFNIKDDTIKDFSTLYVKLHLNETVYIRDLILSKKNTICTPDVESNQNFLIVSYCYFLLPNVAVTVLLPALDKSYDMSIFSTHLIGKPAYGTRTIYVKECESTVNGTSDQIEVLPGMRATYNATGMCACKANHSKLYKDGKSFNETALCNALTKWSGCQGAECWYAPANVFVVQGSKYSKKPANFSCKYDDGFPNETDEVFFIGSWEVPWNKTLNSSDHNKPYRCEANNNYTRDIEKPAKSGNELLVVFFSPEITKPTEDQQNVIELNKSMAVHFDFQANPASGGSINSTFSMPYGSPIKKTFKKTSVDVKYNISYNITINSLLDYGDYYFTVQTDTPNGSDTVLINVVNQTVTTTASPTTAAETTDTNKNSNKNTLYIAIGCSVAVVLIIVLVVFLIVYRRRKEKSVSDKDIKEERENPLYGSAPGPSINAEYATVDKSKKKQEKEEKVNPIYQGTSAGADADTVEEAYAAIDIKKKKKKEKNSEGSENSAFDPEATYAAVNKPKKKKNAEPPPDVVYSAVQKKKKNDQPSDTDLHV